MTFQRILCASLCAMQLFLFGCAPSASKQPEQPASPSSSPAAAVEEQAEAFLTAEIVKNDGGVLLLAGTEPSGAGNLYSLSAKTLSCTDETGEPLDGAALLPGMVVKIGYSGEIAESYPAQPAGAVTLEVLERRSDRVGFYVQVLDDFYQDDPALNDGISCAAFDLTKVNNLSEAEKSAVMLLFAQRYSLEPLSGTFETLCDEGYIDKEQLYFPDGVLFTLQTDAAPEDESFTFSVSKWRSGLGAIGSDDCAATYSDGQWSYEPGALWIS